MNQKKVLGRGLGALIPQKTPAPPVGPPAPAGATEVPIALIEPNPYQPRKSFKDASLEELANSVREHGIVQPLVVTRAGEKYQLIAGERRFRAAQKAGLTSVPVVVKDLTRSGDLLQLALIENIQREDLNPIEEAHAYQQLHDEFALTQEEIAKQVGKERSTVANCLRLLRLPESVKRLVATGELSMGHARALLSVEGAKRQEQLAERVVRNGLNVRQTELLASGPPKVVKKAEKPKDVFTRDAEEKLTRSLRTKVEIDRRRRGGLISIRFTNEEELIRIFEELSGHGRRR
ncbi:MAG: ParB/RepB/Spo0J family partition protein [Thermoanaerobaculia bacterium]